MIYLYIKVINKLHEYNIQIYYLTNLKEKHATYSKKYNLYMLRMYRIYKLQTLWHCK